MAHVREVTRKAGRAYEVRWKDRGKERQRTFSVKRDAERFALKVETEVAAGTSTAAHAKGRTVAQVAEDMMCGAELVLKARSLQEARRINRARLLPRFGARRVTAVTTADVQLWVSEMAAEGLAPATVAKAYVALRKVFKHALLNREVAYNPCDGVRLPKSHDEDTSASFLTKAQVDKLAAALGADDQAPFDLLVRFAAFTGLRAGEIVGLRVGDVDLARQRVSVRQTLQRIAGEWVAGTPKSRRSSRDVPLLSTALVADLRRYLMLHPRSGDPTALLWPARTNAGQRLDYSRPLDLQAFRRNAFARAVAAAELPPMRFHDLRHTAASLWLAAGIEPYRVSRWLGHGSLVTTDTVYAHLYPGDDALHRARFDALDAATA
ncbi:site-specific integrase [Agrococcus sediminis]|uniref:Site-specific integrase n=1 Tax=Agrococcus sediminis TaxID=2599924 RepID=A0A5M8QFW7_9MICO|nr:site-specific integrase [Agrococcus sediminis]KAA6434925.1 site-specific integrase [Agrococcus sediminis]